MDITDVLQCLLGSDFIVEQQVFGYIDIYARKPVPGEVDPPVLELEHKLDGLRGMWFNWKYPIISYGSEAAGWNICDPKFPGTLVDFIKSRFTGRALDFPSDPCAGREW